jgi:hypothetical protein
MDQSIRLRRPEELVEIADAGDATGGTLPASLHLIGEAAGDSYFARGLQKMAVQPHQEAKDGHGDR